MYIYKASRAIRIGHAVLCAKPVIGNEPFLVILPDDLIDDGNRGVVNQLIEKYIHEEKSIIAVQNVLKEDVSKYGIVELAENYNDSLLKIRNIIEKPKPEDAPSTLGVVGRYLLNPEIFNCLEEIQKGSGDEIQLTDAISILLNKESVFAYEFHGIRYDCGSKLGYIEASIQYALNDNEIKDDLKSYILSLDL